jgi:ABC-type transporter MlaC component
MTKIQRFTLIILCSLSWAASANTALYQHTQAVGQSMSALYMQGLSEGNVKYERDLEFYKQKANEALADYVRQDPANGAELSKLWGDLKDNIQATYTDEFGWHIDATIRRDFRSYLSSIYQQSLNQLTPTSSVSDQYQFALVQMESVVARFFDISSTHNGPYSLSNTDFIKLNPEVVSREFKQSLDKLAKLAGKGATAKDLSSAKFKWKFIEKSVVNYSGQSAYFLVYATKNKIQKALNTGQTLLSHNNQ